MAAFAEVSDLESRLNTAFDSGQVDQVTQLLEDASAHLRSIIGQDVFPPATVSFDLWATPGDRDLPLPLAPVVSITSVTINATVVQATLIDGRLLLAQPVVPVVTALFCDPVAVTIIAVVGVPTVPIELVSWCCVLASQALASITELDSLGSGEVTSLAIDDYRKGYAQGGPGPFSVPDRVADRLRARYGGGTYVISSARRR